MTSCSCSHSSARSTSRDGSRTWLLTIRVGVDRQQQLTQGGLRQKVGPPAAREEGWPAGVPEFFRRRLAAPPPSAPADPTAAAASPAPSPGPVPAPTGFPRRSPPPRPSAAMLRRMRPRRSGSGAGKAASSLSRWVARRRCMRMGLADGSVSGASSCIKARSAPAPAPPLPGTACGRTAPPRRGRRPSRRCRYWQCPSVPGRRERPRTPSGVQARCGHQLVGGDPLVGIGIDEGLGDGHQLPPVAVGDVTARSKPAPRFLHRAHPQGRWEHLNPVLLPGQADRLPPARPPRCAPGCRRWPSPDRRRPRRPLPIFLPRSGNNLALPMLFRAVQVAQGPQHAVDLVAGQAGAGGHAELALHVLLACRGARTGPLSWSRPARPASCR